MPAATITIQDQSTATPPANGNLVAKLGVCSGATANVPLVFNSPGAVAPGAGFGPGVESTAQSIRVSEQPHIFVPVNPSIAGTVGSATIVNGNGTPTITAAGAAYDSLAIWIKVTTAGALGAGQVAIAKDGHLSPDGKTDLSTYGAPIELPTPQPASIIGTIDVSTLTYGASGSLDTLTFIATSDTGSQTITFAAPANAAAIVTQLNASAKYQAKLVGNFIQVFSISTGGTGTLTIGIGTGNAVLGFTSTTTATGVAAIYLVPGTNVTFTFPAGTYALNCVEKFVTTEPRFTTVDLAAAFSALFASKLPFSIAHVVGEGGSAADSLAIAAQAKASMLVARGMKIYARAITGCTLLDTDANLKAQFATFTGAELVIVCAGDAPLPDRDGNGNYARSLAWAAATRAATARFSSDLGNGQDGPLEEVTRVPARDEYTATTPLRPFRFTVLESRPGNDGQFFISRGLTMATPNSVFGDFNICRVVDALATSLQTALNAEVNNDFVTKTDGTLDDAEAGALDDKFQGIATQTLIAPQPQHASSVLATVDRTNVIANTKDLRINFGVQDKAQALTVTGSIGVFTQLTANAAA